MRFLLSIIILTLLITYAVLPAMNWIMKFFKAESKRIDKSYTEKDEK